MHLHPVFVLGIFLGGDFPGKTILVCSVDITYSTVRCILPLDT